MVEAPEAHTEVSYFLPANQLTCSIDDRFKKLENFMRLSNEHSFLFSIKKGGGSGGGITTV